MCRAESALPDLRLSCYSGPLRFRPFSLASHGFPEL